MMQQNVPPSLSSTLITTTAVSTRLLVLALEQPDGRVHAQQVYDVAARLEMTDQQVRLCLRRLVQDGFYTASGRGRLAVLESTDRPRALALPESSWAALTRAQDSGRSPWDGAWRLYLVAVPERVRQVRDQLRARFAQLGAATLGGGAYVSPHHLAPELKDLVDTLDAQTYLTTGTSRDLTVAGTSNPQQIAAALWPLKRLDAAYENLRRNTTQPLLRQLGDTTPDAETATGLALTVLVRAAHVMQDDPLLPRELLPATWAGRQARADIDRIAEHLRPSLRDHAPAALRLLST